METQEKSGFYYPNKMVRIYLIAIEEMIGPEAMKALLKLTNTPEFIDNYPPDNLGRQIDFADFSAIGSALEKMYGVRGERGVGLHAGKASFNQGVTQFGSVSGVGELAFKTIPFNTKLKVGLKAMAEAFNQFSDQITRVAEDEEQFIYTIERCPVCWGRTSSRPICYIAAGIIQAGLNWFTGGREFQVDEAACVAMGNEACVFYIRKEPLG